MNALTKVAVVFVLAVTAFSFSQEKLPVQSAQQKESTVVYDTVTVYRTVADSVTNETLNGAQANYSTLMCTVLTVTLEALKGSQTVYSTSFYALIGIVLIVIAVLVFSHMIFVKKLKKKTRRKLRNQQNAFKQELNDLKNIFKEHLDRNRDDIQSYIKGLETTLGSIKEEIKTARDDINRGFEQVQSIINEKIKTPPEEVSEPTPVEHENKENREERMEDNYPLR